MGIQMPETSVVFEYLSARNLGYVSQSLTLASMAMVLWRFYRGSKGTTGAKLCTFSVLYATIGLAGTSLLCLQGAAFETSKLPARESDIDSASDATLLSMVRYYAVADTNTLILCSYIIMCGLLLTARRLRAHKAGAGSGSGSGSMSTPVSGEPGDGTQMIADNVPIRMSDLMLAYNLIAMSPSIWSIVQPTLLNLRLDTSGAADKPHGWHFDVAGWRPLTNWGGPVFYSIFTVFVSFVISWLLYFYLGTMLRSFAAPPSREAPTLSVSEKEGLPALGRWADERRAEDRSERRKRSIAMTAVIVVTLLVQLNCATRAGLMVLFWTRNDAWLASIFRDLGVWRLWAAQTELLLDAFLLAVPILWWAHRGESVRDGAGHCHACGVDVAVQATSEETEEVLIEGV